MTKVWYKLTEPTTPISFGKTVGNEDEMAFETTIHDEFNHELYVIQWTGDEPFYNEEDEKWEVPGTPSLVKKSPEQIQTEQDEKDLLNWRETVDCSRLQAMLALDEAGLLEQIETWINGDAPKVAKLAWKEVYRFSRKSSLFNDFKGLFGLTDEDIDNLFKLALTKEV